MLTRKKDQETPIIGSHISGSNIDDEFSFEQPKKSWRDKLSSYCCCLFPKKSKGLLDYQFEEDNFFENDKTHLIEEKFKL